MGSIRFYETTTAFSMKEAFKNLQDKAKEEYGDDTYNGTINNCQGYKEVTKIFKNSKKSLDKFIEERCENLSKFMPGEGICIEEPKSNSNKIKSKVEHHVTKGTKKWVLYYVVDSKYINYRYLDIKKFKKKGDAVNFARQEAEKFKKPFTVKMEKRLENADSLVATIKYKPSKNEKPGTYVFYGYVSY